ncbi:MAG: hypothetical protein N4A47_05835 [Clostridia bacterium]|jgi:hypothetical protein|nr:hypothetical protein [Clostridia bacterium]
MTELIRGLIKRAKKRKNFREINMPYTMIKKSISNMKLNPAVEDQEVFANILFECGFGLNDLKYDNGKIYIDETRMIDIKDNYIVINKEGKNKIEYVEEYGVGLNGKVNPHFFKQSNGNNESVNVTWEKEESETTAELVVNGTNLVGRIEYTSLESNIARDIMNVVSDEEQTLDIVGRVLEVNKSGPYTVNQVDIYEIGDDS